MSANDDLGGYYFGWYDPDGTTSDAVYENDRGETVPVTAVFQHSLWGPSMWKSLHNTAINVDNTVSFEEFIQATPDERRHCTKLIVDTKASLLTDEQVWKDAVSLTFVQFRKCPNLVQIPDALANCPRLEEVNLCTCPRLKDLPAGLGREPIEVSDTHFGTSSYILHILESGQLAKRWREYLVAFLDDEERLLPDLAKLVVSYL